MPTAREDEIALLFAGARTHAAWHAEAVPEKTLRRLYELTSMGPTGSNAHPMRVVFATTSSAKEKLRPALFPLNVEKTMTAPVTAILAWDPAFYEKMPTLFPARPEMREQLAAYPEPVRDQMGSLSGALQAGYFVMAARALGLDCGPMGGFDRAKTDATFFADTGFRSFLLVNIGHGDATKLYPRLPRLDFDEACRIE